MRINPHALDRLRNAPFSGAGTANIFEKLLEAIGIVPDAEMTVNLDYQTADMEVQEGDLIPVISLTLRPATLVTKTYDA